MKHCPNPVCPARRRGVAEYRDDVEVCAECGTPLEPGPLPRAPAEAPAPEGEAPVSRLVVTLAVGAAALLGGRIPLPGVHPALLSGIVTDVSTFGIFAVGLAPVLAAFVVVELAALVVPAWRWRRTGGAVGRRPLRRAALVLAVAFAALQAVGVTTFLSRVGGLVGPAWLVGLTLVAGTFVLVALADLVDRYGLGAGYSVLLGAVALGQVIRAGRLVAAAAPARGGLGVELGVVALVVVVIVLVTLRTLFLRAPAPVGPGEGPLVLRQPASGIVPLVAAATLLGFAGAVAAWLGATRLPRVLVPATRPFDVVDLASVLVFGVLLSWLFNRPSKVADTWARSRGAPEKMDLFRSAAMRALRTATVRTILFLVFVWVAYRFGRTRVPALAALGAVTLVVLVAVLTDLAAEWRVRRLHGRLVAVWPLHRVYAVEAVLEAFDLAGIPALPRGLHHRSLLHFFGPYVPIDLLVPERDVEDAREILESIVA